MSAAQIPTALVVDGKAAQEILRLRAIANASIALLEAYMAHIIDCEGIDYIDHSTQHSRVHFSPMDRKILEEMAERIRDQQARAVH